MASGFVQKARAGRFIKLSQSLSLKSGLFAVSLLSFIVAAVPASADSLAQMLNDVYDNSPDIRAEESAYEAKRALTRKERSSLFPQVKATGGHDLSETDLKAGGTSRTRTSQYGVTASQRLFNGFQTYNAIRKAKYEARAGRHQIRNQETSILLEAVRAYMDVYAARRMIGLRRQHVANMQKQRRATLARIRAGELTRTDLSKTDALLSRARASLAGAEADLGGAIGRYESLAGYKPRKLAFPQMPKRYVPHTAQAAEQKALSLHPQLRSARANEKASKHAVKAARGSFLPSVDVSGEYNNNFSSSLSETDKAERSFSLRLSMPLFDGGGRYADVQRAKADHNQSRYKTNALTARIRAQARESFLKNKASKAAVRQARAEVKAAKDALRGIRIEEKAGQRSYLDVLDAEIALLDARELLIYSQADSVIAIYTLLSQTGQLTVAGSRAAKLRADYQPTGSIKQANGAASGQSRPRRQKAKSVGKRNPKDPWSGLR